MATVFRTDTFKGELQAPVKTVQGWLLCEGFVARPGVYVYKHADGSISRELVPEDELHDPKSLATLARSTVTLLHPDVDVTPDNVGELGVGDADGTVDVMDNGFVKVKMAIRRKDGLAAVEKGVRELSPGYTVELDETSGEHPVYGRYDAIQRKRRYNHIAIVPTARGGAGMRLRKDAAYTVIDDGQPQPPKRGDDMTEAQVRAILVQLLAEQKRADAEDKYMTKEDMDAKLDAFFTKLKDEFGPKKEGNDDGEGGEADPPKSTKTDGVDDPRKLAALMKRADAWDVEYDEEKVTISELQKAIVLKHNDKARKDAKPAYYEALLDMVPDAPQAPKDPYQSLQIPGNRQDGGGNQPQKSMRERAFDNMRQSRQGA